MIPPVCVSPSQAVVVDRTMYISGQLGMDPASGQLVEGGVQAQTRQVTHKTPSRRLFIHKPGALQMGN